MPFTQALCPIFQRALIDVASQANVSYLRRLKTGFLDSLVSPVNRVGFQITDDITNQNGGTRPIELTYILPGSRATGTTDFQTTRPNLCTDPGREIAPTRQYIDPANLVISATSALVLDENELAKICFSGLQDYKANMIMSQLGPLAEHINRSLMTQMIPLFGHFYNATATPVDVPLHTTTGASNPQGWVQRVKANFKRIGYTDAPIIVGSGGAIDPGIDSYCEIAKIGCCNNNGIDVSQAGNSMYFFYDNEADTIWGDNHFLGYEPGSLQFVSYNKFVGSRKKMVPDYYEKDTLVDPYTGITYDFDLQYEKCDDTWKLSLSLAYMLWALPLGQNGNNPSMYPASPDPMNGVNGTLRFIATTV